MTTGATPARETRLYVVRHGRTAHNLARRIQGPLLDDPLDDVGRAQAAALAARFASLRAAGERFAAVYASPLRRAMETAEPVARALGLRVAPLPGVREFSWGVFDGQVEEGEVERAVRETVERWQAGDVDHAPPEGESPREAAARAAAAVEAIVAVHPGESIVVVAHGRINRILLAELLHEDLARMEEYTQPNTGVTLVTRAPGDARWRIVFVNSRAHLEEPRDGSAAPTTGAARAPMPAQAQDAPSRAKRARPASAEAEEREDPF